MFDEKIERLERVLLENMRRDAAALRELLEVVNGRSFYEDRMYRFYHQSFKVYDLQDTTQRIVAALNGIAPEGQPFCHFFQAILAVGTGREFEREDNQRWVERAGPIVGAFLSCMGYGELTAR